MITGNTHYWSHTLPVTPITGDTITGDTSLTPITGDTLLVTAITGDINGDTHYR